MKKRIGYLFKCILAAVISIVLLSLFSLVYYNPPIASVQPDFSTNYKFIPNLTWSYMLEGFGFGKTDSDGYNNAYYKDCEDIDIVFIGSSHMEALQVPEDANCVYLLNEKFDKDDLSYNNFKCWNLGISGHFFEVTSSNFRHIAEKFQGTKYAVIEVSNVEFTPSVLDEIAAGKFHSPIEKKSFVSETAQRIPFVRLMYKKINEALSANNVPSTDNLPASKSDSDINIYIEKMSALLSEISETSRENGIEPIVLLHERFWEDKDGNIITEMNATYKNAFKECCAINGIRVIDTTEEMIAHYKETFEYSYGFSNSVPGEGHLNKTGHRIIAETVYKEINETEKKK